jgi:hypothetical protein
MASRRGQGIVVWDGSYVNDDIRGQDSRRLEWGRRWCVVYRVNDAAIHVRFPQGSNAFKIAKQVYKETSPGFDSCFCMPL